MSADSAIEWTDHTFNPWWGCTRVSPACAHCYADASAKRFGFPGLWEGSHRFFGDAHWRNPLKWNAAAERDRAPKLVFCASMADVFEPQTALESDRLRLWALIDQTPWLTWQLLTKRPDVAAEILPRFSNAWIGASVENARWTHRADSLRDVDGMLRFLSCEPLLGSLFATGRNRVPLDLDGIGWVIGGGESGPHHRPFDVGWAREIRDACAGQCIPFFWKQNGGLRPKSGGKELDGVEWCEIPEHGPAVLA